MAVPRGSGVGVSQAVRSARVPVAVQAASRISRTRALMVAAAAGRIWVWAPRRPERRAKCQVSDRTGENTRNSRGHDSGVTGQAVAGPRVAGPRVAGQGQGWRPGQGVAA